MERCGTYKAEALRQVLEGLEMRYGLSSEEFMCARASGDDDRLAGVPGFTQRAWADVYDELREPDAQRDGFAEHVEQEPAGCLTPG